MANWGKKRQRSPHRNGHQKGIDPSAEAFCNADGNRSHDHGRSRMINNVGQEQRAGHGEAESDGREIEHAKWLSRNLPRNPARRMLDVVPINLMHPPNKAAKANGISTFDGLCPLLRANCKATGIMILVLPVSPMNAEVRDATPVITGTQNC